MKLCKTYLKDLAYRINGATNEIHRNLGPGLPEGIYRKCLEKELSIRNFNFRTAVPVPVKYKGLEIEGDLHCDLFIENCLMVKLKSDEQVLPSHEAQLLTCMKLMDIPMGLIVSFNLSHSLKTYVNDIYRQLD